MIYALTASLAAHLFFLIARMALLRRAQAADSWRANFDTQRRLYTELRRRSHRRHPRTGRLLPLGD